MSQEAVAEIEAKIARVKTHIAEISAQRSEVATENRYYRELHHKCISWYIQVIGFFIAGILATRIEPSDPYRNFIAWLVFVAVTVMFVSFCIFVILYAVRIEVLNGYLKPEANIPKNWREEHKQFNFNMINFKKLGKGFSFFVFIMFAMGMLAVLLTYFRLKA